MAMTRRLMALAAKRIFDSRPLHAQLVVTEDCNLSCSYCNEYLPGAPVVPFEELKARVDKLDELGALFYDFMGGEPLLHPRIADLARHVKSKRGGLSQCCLITNGFLLRRGLVRELNEARLDVMQVSVDSVEPSARSDKSLKSLLPRLRMLAEEARFKVKVQTVLNEETCADYGLFRELLKELPFSFGFSVMHAGDGRIAIRGRKFVDFLRRHRAHEGVGFYKAHLEAMLEGDFSRAWKCLGGYKYLYVNARGGLQWCAQQRDYRYPLARASLATLRGNDRHKPCEAGCSIGCVRMVSHALGEPLKTLGASVRIARWRLAKTRP